MNPAATLVGVALVYGTRVHLVEEGERLTLCGRAHRLNPRHVHPGFRPFVPAEDATCPKCKTLAASQFG